MYTQKFNEAVKYVFELEGGYVNHANDPGKETNMGITQKILNDYRNSKKLSPKDVKNITKDEATKIYYEVFWVPSKAENYSDPQMSLAVFDGEVQHGAGRNNSFKSQSKGNIDLYMNARNESYKTDRNRASFGEGWSNRLSNLKNYFNKYEETLKKDAFPTIEKTSHNDVYNGYISKSVLKNADKGSAVEEQVNALDESDKKKYEKAIAYQKRVVGLPTERNLACA